MSDWFNVSRLWYAEDATARVQLTERFLAATKSSDYDNLLREYQLLFGRYSSLATIEDVRSVCELLRTASTMFALCHSEGPATFEDFHGCGLSPVFLGWGDAEAPTSEISPDSFVVTFGYRVEPGAYADWLAEAAQTVKARSFYAREAMRFDAGYLSYSSELRGMDAYADAHKDCASILERLLNIHLVDVATVCDGTTANHRQVAYSGVSLLWLGLSELLSGGRPFRCEACGKPSVAYGERRIRRYCCSACRKWANAHPGQERGHWYIEKR